MASEKKIAFSQSWGSQEIASSHDFDPNQDINSNEEIESSQEIEPKQEIDPNQEIDFKQRIKSSQEIESDQGIESYEEVIAYYNEPRWMKVSLGLDRIKLLLEYLGNPQDRFSTVHVAGTNGKGSICSCLDSILRESGLKCGLFTSPYIEVFEERIRINGENISKDDLISITRKVRIAAIKVEKELGEHPTEFELMCAAGFLHFANQECDVVVCEVGLGGRLDATNVVKPILSVIARIGLDHTAILGSTIAEIALEKAGIIKRGIPVVSWPQSEEAMNVIEDICAQRGCELVVSDFESLQMDTLNGLMDTRTFTYEGNLYSTSMIASYQIQNAAIAIDAAKVLSKNGYLCIDEKSIESGIRMASWPGRFEILGTSPFFLVDGAHNPQGAKNLVESIKELNPNEEDFLFICGLLADKDCSGVIDSVLPIAKRFIVYAPDNPRAYAANDLAVLISDSATSKSYAVDVEVALSPEDAVRRALEKASPEEKIISFGTLYALSDIKNAYLRLMLLSEK